jgi:uncharacterized Zn finger protein
MGNIISNIIIKPNIKSKIRQDNYKCPSCMEEGQIHNINRRFHIISLTQCQCNGCGSIFKKKDFYNTVDIRNNSFIDVYI